MRKIRHKSDNLKRTGTGCRKVMSFILVLGLLLSLVPNGNMPGLVYGAGSNTEITEDVQPPEAASTAAEEASEEMTGAETTEAPELETTATEEAETSTEPVDGEGTTELTTTEAATEAVLAGDEPETRALSDYHAGDVAVVNNIIQKSGVGWTGNPDSWPTTGGRFVKWSDDPVNKRIEELAIVDLIRLTDVNLDISVLTQLKYLDCRGCYLTNLDVSQNLQLETLYCSNNKLTNLDVSQNLQLKTLYCSVNMLTNLDVSQNSQLKFLECESNDMRSLDVSQNPQLEYLKCKAIGNLDVSQNPQLKNLWCDNSTLANPDLSSNPQLEIFGCANGDLTGLDVSQNSKLEALACNGSKLTNLDVSQNPKLQTLRCYSNQLTNLDVSQNPQLQTLQCFSNQLTNLDVSQNPKLQQLLCYANKLTNLDVSQNPQLQTLMCFGNQLTNLDVSQNPLLRTLMCQSQRNGQLKSLISLNLQRTNITSLNCEDNSNLQTIIRSSGDKISLQTSPGGRVEFINMTSSNAANLSIRAVPDSGVSFRKWDAPAGRLTYTSGNDTASDITVNVATGADTTITALFNAPPSVSTPAFTNENRTSVDFNGTYLANGYAMDYSANACRYRKVGDTTWSTAGVALTYNAMAGTYAGSITGLTSNTSYELEVYFENTQGGTWSAPGTFVTTLDLMVDTPSINLPSLEATISGRYGVGDQPATVEVTYGLDPLLLTGAATINATVNPGLKTFTATIPGLTMGTPYYYQVTAVNSTSNSPVSSGILSFTLGHQVVVRHVDKTGTVLPGEAATGDLSYVTTTGSPYTVPTKTVTNYEPAYYTLGSNPTRYPLTTTQTITGDTDITVYYASTLIRVVYPNTPMEFDALDTNHGHVKSPDYLFENQSDLPLRVSFKKMGVVNNAGLRFVTNAASRDEIHLNLEAAGSSNGFTNDLTGIVPDTTYTVPHVFGTLDGALPMSGDTGHNQGKLKIGGYFVGPFTVTAKRPQVEFTFNFYLMDP